MIIAAFMESTHNEKVVGSYFFEVPLPVSDQTVLYMAQTLVQFESKLRPHLGRFMTLDELNEIIRAEGLEGTPLFGESFSSSEVTSL